MQTIDKISYHCGVIDCFNEMIQAEVKTLALSHPLHDIDEYHVLLPFVEQTCVKYNTQYYYEEAFLESPLFLSDAPCAVYLFYKDEDVLQAYFKLKHRKQDYERQNLYTKERQVEIAILFAELLSYPKHIYEAMIAKNMHTNSL